VYLIFLYLRGKYCSLTDTYTHETIWFVIRGHQSALHLCIGQFQLYFICEVHTERSWTSVQLIERVNRERGGRREREREKKRGTQTRIHALTYTVERILSVLS
jgi:hypothetical protein